jgi:hypothetical protein
LRQIENDWQSVEASQDHLSGLLNKAPKGMEFYNRMQIVREQKRQMKSVKKKNESRIRNCLRVVKKGFGYVEHECKNDEPILFGNEILTISDAQKIWTTNMDEILNLREANPPAWITFWTKFTRSKMSSATTLTISKQVQRVGERFSRLNCLHDLLSSYWQTDHTAGEITVLFHYVRDRFPALWSSGIM